MLAVVAAVAGAVLVGPFLSYAVLRWVGWRVALPLVLDWVPARAQVGRPSARCRSCGHQLSPAAVPALPWLLRMGRCRSCRTGIGRWALGIEIATGVVFGLIVWQLDDWKAELPALALGAGLVAISAVDLGFSRIPSRFVYLTALAVAITGVPLFVDEPRAVVGAAVGGGACLALLGSMHLISPRMLGFGDVRLGTLIGAVVGWLGWTETEPILDPLSFVITALFVAGLVGSLAGFALLAIRRRSVAYPFGPCLALGGIIALLL